VALRAESAHYDCHVVVVVVVVVQFSQLLQMRQRLGKENFPLIDQTYFPSHREMVSADSIVMVHYSGSSLGLVVVAFGNTVITIFVMRASLPEAKAVISVKL